jgi:hypothetical protein
MILLANVYPIQKTRRLYHVYILRYFPVKINTIKKTWLY